jgi:hypothetical protein
VADDGGRDVFSGSGRDERSAKVLWWSWLGRKSGEIEDLVKRPRNLPRAKLHATRPGPPLQLAQTAAISVPPCRLWGNRGGHWPAVSIYWHYLQLRDFQ